MFISKRKIAVVGGLSALLLLVTGCAAATSEPAASNSAQTWDQVLQKAKGQTVNWYMYGGDDRLNSYVTGYVAQAAAKLGVTVNEVKITDTVDAVNKVLGEKQAGKTTGGSVDLIWLNGENFATGKQANLWKCGWPQSLPNSKFVDWKSDAITSDFGTPVDNCEAPWNQSMSVIVYNSNKAAASDFSSVKTMAKWAKQNPGQFTYPAPPDFNGSMAVRRFFYEAAGGYDKLLGKFDQAKYDRVAPKAWKLLNHLKPSMWRNGSTFPKSIDNVQQLFSSGEISAYLSYDAGGVGPLVDKNVFPASTREAVFANGMIGNTNYVAIPANAKNQAGAQVLANILESPEAQLEKAKPDVLGYYPAIQMDKTPLATAYAALPNSPSVLPYPDQQKNANPELTAKWIAAIEDGWKKNVLQQ